MAIFGKKKEKNATGQEGSPVLEQSASMTASGSQARGTITAGPTSPSQAAAMGHGSKGSLSGPSGIPTGAGYGYNNGSMSNGSRQNMANMVNGGMQGPPGAANNFKFGGPQQRPDGGMSAIPAPTGSQMRGVPPMEGQAGSNAPYGGAPPNGSQPLGMPNGGGSMSGLPVPSQGGPPLQTGPSGPNDRPRNQQVVYPWSQRPLSMNAPRFLDEARQAQAIGAISPSPFPRYGHAANATASASGEIYLFGGLVRESVKNDLYVVYVDRIHQPAAPIVSSSPTTLMNLAGGVNATLVQTTGEIPPPRVGHATVLVANVLILWGGDTKVRADDKQDEGLYLLNLSTREWTRVRPSSEGPNAGPVGRYGHTVSIVGSKFYVFGGQVDGTFMNDIWSFDLNSLKTQPTWELLQPSSDAPPRRTGHASVTYKDKIYIFGGTDGQYHYNDTWCYDVATNAWKEMSCIGYIPVPREGHAACLVDDIMYIFGGRGVDGKDLGDLASFRISNQRWYMFANMGPSPSGRSGHALTAYQNKVVVLGGESFTGAKPDDPAIVYVLDTAKIKYPPESAIKGPAAASTSGIRKPGSVERAISPTERATSPSQRGIAPAAPMASLAQQQGQIQQQQAPQPMVDPAQSNIGSAPTLADPAVLPADRQQISAQSGPSNGPSGAVMAGAGAVAAATGATIAATTMSPTQRSNPAAVTQQSPVGPITQTRQGSLPNGTSPAQPLNYGGPRSQRSLDNMRNGTGAISPSTRAPMPHANGILNDRTTTMSPTPVDGFHYAGMPNGRPPVAAPMGQLSETETLRKRDAWMRAALAMAVKRGYVAPEELDTLNAGTEASDIRSTDINLDELSTGPPGSEKERIVRALVSLKAQLAQSKANIAQQALNEADRVGESDRARLAALSEAAFYRAKLDALENGNTNEAERLQRQRNNDIERQLSESLRETGAMEKQLTRLREELKLEQQLRTQADERLAETSQRATAAETTHLDTADQLANLQRLKQTQEAQLREHRERVATLTSLAARHQSDHEATRSQLDEYRTTADQHANALRELQAGLAAATARAAEHERAHGQSRELVNQHESTIAHLRAELSAKTVEADGHATRKAELEALLARQREEAEAHRQAINGGLSQVLTFHRQQQSSRSAEPLVPSHIQERMRALQEESDSMRQVHEESKQAAQQAHAALDEMRQRNLTLEKQQSGLRSELTAMRSQLAIALHEVSRLKEVSGTREVDLRDAKHQAEAAQVKHALLRQFMADRGMAVPGEDELAGNDGGVANRRIQELERQVEAQGRQLAQTEAQLREAVSRADTMTRELDQANARASSSRAAAAQQPQIEEAQRRATTAERELAEAHSTYRERAAQLETDYQTAVQFVKGSEKMLRRMKDELTKYKTENSTLQDQLMNARAGVYSPDNEAAKDIEALRLRLTELTQQHNETTAENRELERRMAALIAEQKEFRDRNREALEATPGSASVSGAVASSAKVAELEAQLHQLEDSLADVRTELQESLQLNTHLSNELTAASKAASSTTEPTAAPSATASTLARNLNAAQIQNEQLRNERDALQHKLQETEDKLQLLLSNDSEVGGEAATRDSHAFSISSELDKWERGAGVPDTIPRPPITTSTVNTPTTAHPNTMG